MARSVSAALTLSLWLLLSAPFAHANSVDLMNFIGLQNGQPVGNFYNGAGVPSTPNYGVTFSSNFIGLRPSSLGAGAGGLLPDPSSTPYIYINGGTLATMNVAGGFSSGLNFYYQSLAGETVTVWSGTGGSGTILAMRTISASCPSVASCPNLWGDVAISFSGAAKSVTFSGPGNLNNIGIADITLGQSITALPEPSSIYLLGTGLLGIVAYQIRRFILT